MYDLVICFNKVIAAEGEKKASHALKEAADVINQSANALQLRYLQTLTQISAEKNSTIIFPLPVDLLSACVTSRPGSTHTSSASPSSSVARDPSICGSNHDDPEDLSNLHTTLNLQLPSYF